MLLKTLIRFSNHNFILSPSITTVPSNINFSLVILFIFLPMIYLHIHCSMWTTNLIIQLLTFWNFQPSDNMPIFCLFTSLSLGKLFPTKLFASEILISFPTRNHTIEMILFTIACSVRPSPLLFITC